MYFTERKYYFYEPSAEERKTVVFVAVIRDGDITTSSAVTIETRDGSATSSLHYEPFAKVAFLSLLSSIVVGIQIWQLGKRFCTFLAGI